MTPERYQRIGQLFDEVVALAPEQRSAYLEQICSAEGEGDVELRAEVEKLLAHQVETEEFLARPAMDVAAELLADQEPTSPLNKNISHYQIISLLGAGGMGAVYLAEDLRLRRKVALKVLPTAIAEDVGRLRRFEREAHAVSALNHPNILTVHEFGVENGVHFLVTELVEGITLREKIRGEVLSLEESLNIAEQIAFALSAAHAAGIIHRDLKPENIMLRTDGIVKVLDFGLAKLTGPPVESIGSEDKTLKQITHQTKPGAIMGTLHYMSPEQVRGQSLDVRTDIFSFGIVLYEMLTGKEPFDKPTAMDVMAAILTEEPPQITDERPDAPADLQRIVSKTLAKNRDERYQTSKDLLQELRRLSKELEYSVERERVTMGDKARSTNEVKMQVTNAGRERRFTLPHLLVVVAVAILAIVGIWWLAFKGSSAPLAPAPATLEMVAVASWRSRPGEIYVTGSFSQDGRMIAFTSTQVGKKNIWVKQISGGEAVQVTKDEFTNQNPIWSPNGQEIAFFSTRAGTSGIWRSPALGGTPTLLKTVSDGSLVLRYWSKKDVIYYAADRNLWALNLPTGQVTQLTNLDVTKVNQTTISISPNEEQIVCVTFEKAQYAIWTMPTRGGSAKQIARNANEIKNTIWHTDNQRILYSALVAGVFQVFVTDINGRQPAQITFGDKDCLALDVSADGTKILCGSSKEEADVWGVRTEPGQEFSIAADINSELWASTSPDGKTIAYQSINNLSQGDKIFSGAILTKSTDSEAQPFQLVSNGFLPTWSPDGNQLAFMRVTGETYNLWVINAAGGQEKQITTNGLLSPEFTVLPYNRTQASNFCWSPDGKRIAYVSDRNVWMVDLELNTTTQLTNNLDINLSSYCPLWSSNGKQIAYMSKQKASNGSLLYLTSTVELETRKTQPLIQSSTAQRLLGWSQSDQDLLLATVNSKTPTGSPTEVTLIQVHCQSSEQRQVAKLEDTYFYNIHLSSNKKLIAFTSHKEDKDNIWVLNSNGSNVRQLTLNNDPRLYYSSLSWSPDNQMIYFGKQTRYSLLSMITNFQ